MKSIRHYVMQGWTKNNLLKKKSTGIILFHPVVAELFYFIWQYGSVCAGTVDGREMVQRLR